MNTETAIAIVISVPLGIVCSLAAWWILFRYLAPELEFSSQISKREDGSSPCGYRYRIKMKNVGARPAIDIEASVSILIAGLNPARPITSVRVPILASSGRVFKLSERVGNRVLNLSIDPAPFLKYDLDGPVRLALLEGRACLEDVMDLGTEAHIVARVFANDSFSGARKLFESPQYEIGDIAVGRFEKGGVDLVTPDAAPPGAGIR